MQAAALPEEKRPSQPIPRASGHGDCSVGPRSSMEGSGREPAPRLRGTGLSHTKENTLEEVTWGLAYLTSC